MKSRNSYGFLLCKSYYFGWHISMYPVLTWVAGIKLLFSETNYTQPFPHFFLTRRSIFQKKKFNVPEKQFIISMGSFRSKFSIKIFGHRHMSNESEWRNAKANHKSPKICLFSILQALISVRFASNQPHFWSPRTYLTSIFLQKVQKHIFPSNDAQMLLFFLVYSIGYHRK